MSHAIPPLRLRARLASLLIACGVSLSGGGVAWSDSPKVSKDHAERAKAGIQIFQKSVRGHLTKHCLDCHGGKSTKADFDLSTRERLMESGFVDETAQDSHLMALIRHEEEPKMPLKKPKLQKKTIAEIAKWIDLGAPYDKPLVEHSTDAPEALQVTNDDRGFWSFGPLRNVKPPRVTNESWVRNDIDRFILAKLESMKLKPAETAAPRTLARRAHLTLTGLPPDQDESPGDYEQLIDRLLNSPHYGERWARHWIDVARFAESTGFEHDYNRGTAFHYRDFLIEAFNRDTPWADMVRWQIAGDEIDPDNPLAIKATGFLAAGVFPTQLTEVEFEPARYDELDDIVGTMGVAFLGLSTGCARCHDHKFDPIPTRDYYRLVSVFGSAIRSEIKVPADQKTAENQRNAWIKKRDAIQADVEKLEGDAKKKKQDELTRHLKTEADAALVNALAYSEGMRPLKHHADGRGYPHFYKEVYFLKRGDTKQKDGVATPGFLQVLMADSAKADKWRPQATPSDSKSSYRRSSLANWLTDHESGAGRLLARVIVNRLWQHHFGRGLVATPNDFGLQGAEPTHPDLLDWLAADLIQHGWKLKRLHKMIMTSACYRQNAVGDPGQAVIDIENRFLWRYPARRLEAEAIRDSMLAVAGVLDKTMYGPGSLNESMSRRSVYFTIKRSKPIPMMQVFDWPEHLVSIGDRASTTIAPQALTLMNNSHVRRYADAFAKRIAQRTDGATTAFVEASYLAAYYRQPTNDESKRAIAFIESQSKKYGSDNAAQHRARVDYCQALFSSNEFLHTP